MKRKLLLALCALIILTACLSSCSSPAADWQGMEPVSTMELQYATQFSVDYYEGGRKLITIGDGRRYLLVGPEADIPVGLPQDVTVIRSPQNIYLAATSAMDMFRSLDAVGDVRLSGTDVDGWAIHEAREALERGDMLYAGRYNAPGYELLLSENCGLAIESTMIYHTPEVKEQLESLGIPVLVERSSYESDPIGRMEWVKLYGALLDKEDKAEKIFTQAVDSLEPVLHQPPTGKTVAYFYINSMGTVNVRRSGDYVSEMIRMAGGSYVPADTGDADNALSTVNMDQESFYAAAKESDILIYNSSITGELQTIAQLLDKCPLLSDFKAVQSGSVFCTEQNLFQESMGLASLILDLHAILTDPEPQKLTYLHRLT